MQNLHRKASHFSTTSKTSRTNRYEFRVQHQNIYNYNTFQSNPANQSYQFLIRRKRNSPSKGRAHSPPRNEVEHRKHPKKTENHP